MGELERFDNQVWDRFFDFVTPDVEQMSSSEVDAALQRAGIDPTGAFVRVQQALDARKAREQLARARAARPSVIQKLKEIGSVPIENARQVLHEMISHRAPKSAHGVLFRKLEKAATDADIESILLDIQRLDQLDAEGDDAGR